MSSEAIKKLALKIKIKSPSAKKRKKSAKKGRSSPLAQHTDTIFNKTYSTTNLKIIPKHQLVTIATDEPIDLSAKIVLDGKR